MLTSKQIKELPKGTYTNQALADIYGTQGLKSRETSMPVRLNKKGQMMHVISLTDALQINGSKNITIVKMRLNRANSRRKTN